MKKIFFIWLSLFVLNISFVNGQEYVGLDGL